MLQSELYERCGLPDMVRAAADGYHATVFAYGQTGGCGVGWGSEGQGLLGSKAVVRRVPSLPKTSGQGIIEHAACVRLDDLHLRYGMTMALCRVLVPAVDTCSKGPSGQPRALRPPTHIHSYMRVNGQQKSAPSVLKDEPTRVPPVCPGSGKTYTQGALSRATPCPPASNIRSQKSGCSGYKHI